MSRMYASYAGWQIAQYVEDASKFWRGLEEASDVLRESESANAAISLMQERADTAKRDLQKTKDTRYVRVEDLEALGYDVRELLNPPSPPAKPEGQEP